MQRQPAMVGQTLSILLRANGSGKYKRARTRPQRQRTSIVLHSSSASCSLDFCLGFCAASVRDRAYVEAGASGSSASGTLPARAHSICSCMRCVALGPSAGPAGAGGAFSHSNCALSAFWVLVDDAHRGAPLLRHGDVVVADPAVAALEGAQPGCDGLCLAALDQPLERPPPRGCRLYLRGRRLSHALGGQRRTRARVAAAGTYRKRKAQAAGTSVSSRLS